MAARKSSIFTSVLPMRATTPGVLKTPCWGGASPVAEIASRIDGPASVAGSAPIETLVSVPDVAAEAASAAGASRQKAAPHTKAAREIVDSVFLQKMDFMFFYFAERLRSQRWQGYGHSNARKKIKCYNLVTIWLQFGYSTTCLLPCNYARISVSKRIRPRGCLQFIPRKESGDLFPATGNRR